MKHVLIYTDGACSGNPGPGGWGCILRYQEHCREISGGYVRTTNNRMELMAAIASLETLLEPCSVELHSDSAYLVKAIEEHWLDNWKRNGWRTAGKKPVSNEDLWRRLDRQLARHQVSFCWLKGHAGHPENERCDELARTAAKASGNPDDAGFLPSH